MEDFISEHQAIGHKLKDYLPEWQQYFIPCYAFSDLEKSFNEWLHSTKNKHIFLSQLEYHKENFRNYCESHPDCKKIKQKIKKDIEEKRLNNLYCTTEAKRHEN